ncbi:MAG TPA: aminotransferase class V-fold PLP-dependent enzyme [Cellulomonas sp.]
MTGSTGPTEIIGTAGTAATSGTAGSDGAPLPLTLPDGTPAAAAWTLDPGLLHLNHGSYGAVPRAAQAAQQRWRDTMEQSPPGWFADLPAAVATARGQVASFVGVPDRDLAFVTNASAGASIVLASLPGRQGDEIVVTDHGYGAVTMGAERWARRHGGRVRTARIPLGATAQDAHDAVVAEIGDRTVLVVVDQITSATARTLPVAEITRSAHARGVPVLVDAAHAPGAQRRPATGLDCDFWVGNLHKFACAPRGTAVLVARGPLTGGLYPSIDSWAAHQPFPDRFDTQGTVDATSHLAAPAALDFVARTWGWDTVRDYAGRLLDHATETVAAAFAALTGTDHRVDTGTPVGPLRLVRLPGRLAGTPDGAHAVRDRLLAELGIETAVTEFGGAGYLRLSAHAYNTAAEYQQFTDRAVPALVAWSRDVP